MVLENGKDPEPLPSTWLMWVREEQTNSQTKIICIKICKSPQKWGFFKSLAGMARPWLFLLQLLGKKNEPYKVVSHTTCCLPEKA